MQDLTHLREQIDQIDSELIELIAQRMGISREIAEYKKQVNEPIYDPHREEAMFAKLTSTGKELGLPPMVVKAIWQEIITQSRRLQQQAMK